MVTKRICHIGMFLPALYSKQFKILGLHPLKCLTHIIQKYIHLPRIFYTRQ